MPNLNQFVDSTGTTLNRYKIIHSDTTEEEVTLEYYPSEDYVQGTALNASNVNPVIDDVNACTEAIGNLKFVSCTQAEYDASAQESGTIYFVRES